MSEQELAPKRAPENASEPRDKKTPGPETNTPDESTMERYGKALEEATDGIDLSSAGGGS